MRHRHCRGMRVRQHGDLIESRARLCRTVWKRRTQHGLGDVAQGACADGGARERCVRAFVRDGQSSVAERGRASGRVIAAAGTRRGAGDRSLGTRLHHGLCRRLRGAAPDRRCGTGDGRETWIPLTRSDRSIRRRRCRGPAVETERRANDQRPGDCRLAVIRIAGIREVGRRHGEAVAPRTRGAIWRDGGDASARRLCRPGNHPRRQVRLSQCLLPRSGHDPTLRQA